MELTKIWIEMVPRDKRPNLNINDKKLMKGGRLLYLEMLKLKQGDKEVYEEKNKS